jgi:SsrA-binding protein
VKIVIENKKALFNFFILEKFQAGVVLLGTEIKSIRDGKISIQNAFCIIENNEIFIVNMHISQYKFGNIYNHDETRKKKLLLKKQEIIKIKNKILKGTTIVPLKVYLDKHNIAKIEIAIAKGKKLYDKRQAIKERDLKRKK